MTHIALVKCHSNHGQDCTKCDASRAKCGHIKCMYQWHFALYTGLLVSICDTKSSYAPPNRFKATLCTTKVVWLVRSELYPKRGFCTTTPMIKFGTHICLGEGVSVNMKRFHYKLDQTFLGDLEKFKEDRIVFHKKWSPFGHRVGWAWPKK